MRRRQSRPAQGWKSSWHQYPLNQAGVPVPLQAAGNTGSLSKPLSSRPGCSRLVSRSVRQREDGQHTTEVGVLAECGMRADGAQTGMRVVQASRQADAGPTADARQHGDVLLAAGDEGV